MRIISLYLVAMCIAIAAVQMSHSNILQSRITAVENSVNTLKSQVTSLKAAASQQSTALLQKSSMLAQTVDIFRSTRANPVAHVYGHYSGKYTSNTVLNGWNLRYPSVLSGGMTLSSDRSKLTVPAAGVYYIYGQLMLDPTSGDSSICAFALRVNSYTVASSYTYGSRSGSVDHTKYTGVVRALNKGDSITIRMLSTCTVDNFHLGESFLGAVYISFRFSDYSTSAAMTYGYYTAAYKAGTLLNRWGQYHNTQQGGASISSYGVTAGTSGFYFVFGQLQLDPQSSSQRCGFKLAIGSKILSYLHIQTNGGRSYDRTEYTGLVVKMNSKERLQMTSATDCTLVNNQAYGSFIGAFYLPFQREPAIHLYSSISGGTLYRGATLACWSSKPTIATGNVRYSPSGFTVPKSGIYYVYVQLEFDPTGSSQKNCGYELRTGMKIIAAAHYWKPNPAAKDRVTYTGAAVQLRGGDTISVGVIGTCNIMRDEALGSFLGGFYLRN